ncbi:MAG: cyclic-di-AMP receptor [Bacilli bacterium]|nr:cyclic-di-AMP receptor [Bacilli bacterium]MDD7314480.1 cyclic-di-AMP receptor [Bacilli bacterium]MDY4053057.1 cyclic-di-AMP receptor [Bacilli bacterium]
MKLVLIIVTNEDAKNVTERLLKEKYFVTKLASTGGLLRNGNTTFLVGTEDDRVSKLVATVGEVAKTRKKKLNRENVDEYGILNSFPFEVNVNGATIFVLDVKESYKL